LAHKKKFLELDILIATLAPKINEPSLEYSGTDNLSLSYNWLTISFGTGHSPIANLAPKIPEPSLKKQGNKQPI
jgi:hypothetical protein